MSLLHTALMALLLFPCMALSRLSFARPFTPDDQGYLVTKMGQDIRIEADATLKTRFTSTVKILTEEGIRSYSVYNLSYNTNTQTLDVHNIEVRNPEGVTVIDAKNIEEKSMFGGHSGYDETKTKVIPLPNVKIGTEIFVDYTQNLFHPPFKDVISTRLPLFFGNNIGEFSLTLTVPETAKVRLHDPVGTFTPLLKDERAGGRRKFSLAVKDSKGVATTLENSPTIPESAFAWIDVTSLTSWEEAAKIAAVGFDKAFAEPLSPELTALFGEKPASPLDKDRAKARLGGILQQVSKTFRYFGDWRSVDGGFIPRPLSDIGKTGYGDCKDFSALVTSAARYLGLEADVAWVQRADNPWMQALDPHLNIYTHAISRVKIPGEENFWWLDATNSIPQLGLTPHDIAGRHALILGKGAFQIPRDSPDMSSQDITLTMDPTLSPDNHFTTRMRMSGHIGWSVKAQLFGRSEKEIEEYMMSYLGVSLYDVRDFQKIRYENFPDYPYTVEFEFSLTEVNGVLRAGSLKILHTSLFGDAPYRVMDVIPETRTADLDMGSLKTVRARQNLKTGTYQEIVGAPTGCKITSPWIELERAVTTAPEFSIHDTYRVLKTRVTVVEIKSPEFVVLQKNLRDCVKGVKIVVR